MSDAGAPVSLSAQEEEEAEERSRVGGEVLRIVLDFKIALRKRYERKRDATLERCEGKGRVSGGCRYSLALRAGKTIVQWGQDPHGQGPPEGRVLAVSAGAVHALALCENGRCACWWSNDEGQAPPEGVAGPLLAVSAGVDHSAALRWDGTVIWWGGVGGQGELQRLLGGPYAAVSAGYAHTAAINEGDGSAVCFFHDEEDDYNPHQVEDVVPPPGPFVAISLGGDDEGFHCVALREDGSLAFWGRNYHGKAPPGEVPGRFTAVAAGLFHSMALREDGAVVFWGDNEFGQAPREAQVAGGERRFLAIAAGYGHSLALSEEEEGGGGATVVCWGHNAYGQAPPEPVAL